MLRVHACSIRLASWLLKNHCKSAPVQRFTTVLLALVLPCRPGWRFPSAVDPSASSSLIYSVRLLTRHRLPYPNRPPARRSLSSCSFRPRMDITIVWNSCLRRDAASPILMLATGSSSNVGTSPGPQRMSSTSVGPGIRRINSTLRDRGRTD